MNLFARIKALFSRPQPAPQPVVDRPFQVGDRVLANDPGYHFGAQRGVITKAYSPRCFAVRLTAWDEPTDGGPHGWSFYTHELTLLS